MRESGYYWIKFKNHEWEIAKYTNDPQREIEKRVNNFWEIIGEESSMSEYQVENIECINENKIINPEG
jgi:hypothetical protein